MWWRVTAAVILLEDFNTYFAILLGRCAMLSLPISVLVVILRRTLLQRTIFLKGMIWGMLLIVPFMGKLNLFYDHRLIYSLSIWWNDICMIYRPVGYGYMLCVLVYAGYMIYRYREIRRTVQYMEKGRICDYEILINQMPVTPFSTGLIHAKTVIPIPLS